MDKPSYAAPDLVPGLYNNGNTCFANAILQALAPVAPMHSYLADVARANLCVEKLRRDREAKEHTAEAEEDDLLYIIDGDDEEDVGGSTRALGGGGDEDADPKRALLERLERVKEARRRLRASGSGSSSVTKRAGGWRSGAPGSGNEETTYTLAVRLLQTLSRLNLPLSTDPSSPSGSGSGSSDNPSIDLGSVSSVFSDGGQHDAHEFLLHLLALIDDDQHLHSGWSDLQAAQFEQAVVSAAVVAASKMTASPSEGSPASASSSSPRRSASKAMSLFASARLSRGLGAASPASPKREATPQHQPLSPSLPSQLRSLPCRGLTNQRILCRSCFGSSSSAAPRFASAATAASLNKPSWVQEAFNCLSLTLPQHQPFGSSGAGITLKGLLAQYFVCDEISGYRCPNDNCPAKLRAEAAASSPSLMTSMMNGSKASSSSKSDREAKSLRALANATSASLRASSSSSSGYQGGPAVKQVCISKLPEVLLLHIKRQGFFDVPMLGGGGGGGGAALKVDSRFTFDLCLDMSRFLTNAITASSSSSAGASASDSSALYDLVSVVEHLGGGRGGHYVTYRRVPALYCDPSSALPQWVFCSDSTVRPVDVSRVLHCEAYLLCYVRRAASSAASTASSAWLQRSLSSALSLDYRSSLILGLSGDPDKDLGHIAASQWMQMQAHQGQGCGYGNPCLGLDVIAADLVRQAAAAEVAANGKAGAGAGSAGNPSKQGQVKLKLTPVQAAQLALVRPPSTVVEALVLAAAAKADAEATNGTEGVSVGRLVAEAARAKGWINGGRPVMGASAGAGAAVAASSASYWWLGIVESICSRGVLHTDSAHSMALRPVWYPRE